MSIKPLHCRSYYSLLQGLKSPERLCSLAAAAGHSAVGMVDVNNFYGLPDFLAAAAEHGLKPMAGVELVAGGRLLLTAYCLDRAGFGRACGILTRLLGGPAGPGRPAVDPADYDPLADLAAGGWEGLVLASGDQAVLDRLLAAGRRDLAVALEWGRPFRDNAAFARRRGLPLVAWNDAVFENEDELDVAEVLAAIRLNRRVAALAEADRLGPWQRLASAAEQEAFFSAVPEALAGAAELAERLDARRLLPESYVFPAFRGQSERESYARLAGLCRQGIARRYGRETPQIAARLAHELSIIRDKGFAAYFLVVQDLVRSCPRTCGRGSAASSLVSFLLGITHVDPLRHDLFFERFLNRSRRDPPDIDVDFPWDEREKALAYVFETYAGRAGMVADHVCFQLRSAYREPARVLGLTAAETGKIMELVERGELECVPAYLTRYAAAIRGMPRLIGTHPGGVVITPGPITGHVHLQTSELGRPLIAWEKEGAEAAGLVKIDLLGNRSLGVLRDAIVLVNARRKKRIGWESLEAADNPATRAFMESGDTLGVFYIESPATRQLLAKMGTADFDSLVIASSIIRPAANKYIKEFVRRLRGGAWTAISPEVERTLAETKGIMVYQEDVARVAIAAAGFSAEEADGLSKALTKKKRNQRIQGWRGRFMAGAAANGLPVETAGRLWEMFLAFDGYSFCKAHSASYAQVSCRLAYLKRHYPLEFFAAVINNGGGFYSRQVYLNAVRRAGFAVLGPDVNASELEFSLEGGRLRVGLGQIRALPAAGRIAAERRKAGRYRDLEDFLRRVRPEPSELRMLIRSGALDSASGGASRPALFWRCARRDADQPGLGVAESGPPAWLGDYRPETKRDDELETLGLALSFHPVERAIEAAAAAAGRRGLELTRSVELASRAGSRVALAGMLVTGKEVLSSAAEPMCFLSFEDELGMYETTAFPAVFERLRPLLDRDGLYLAVGTVQLEFGVAGLILEDLFPLCKTSYN